MRHLIALLALLAAAAHADTLPDPRQRPGMAAGAALYDEECAACHLAYPPQLLHADSWRALLGDLPHHFGTDASMEEQRRLAIADFLTANAGGGKTGNTRNAAGKPLLRITETERFLKKHRKIAPAVWRRTSIGSPANCLACHTGAAAYDFNDDKVRIPK